MPTRDTLFSTLPDDARCWIYTADQPLTNAEQETLLNTLTTFFESWTSHSRPVQGDAVIMDDRFLIVAATLAAGDISGCGIDKSVHAVETVAQDMGFTWTSPLQIFFRDADGTVQHTSRPAFRRLVGEGTVTANTPVFDVSLTTLGPLRNGAFELPAGRSWHARIFRIPQPAA
ncbi:MAG TPA: hypothetical protein VKP65_10295 [Rhodothermales bacterium]|nr:hypothetical protein [Rhodothermales bacterium]